MKNSLAKSEYDFLWEENLKKKGRIYGAAFPIIEIVIKYKTNWIAKTVLRFDVRLIHNKRIYGLKKLNMLFELVPTSAESYSIGKFITWRGNSALSCTWKPRKPISVYANSMFLVPISGKVLLSTNLWTLSGALCSWWSITSFQR